MLEKTGDFFSLEKKSAPWLITCIAIALCAPSLWSGLAVDDYWHQVVLQGSSSFSDIFPKSIDIFAFMDGDPARNQRLMDLGISPWWSSADVKIAFWRPLTALTHQIDVLLWSFSPMLMHAQSLFWFGALIIAVGALYKQMLGASVCAGFALLMFGIDDNHGVVVGWLANRNVLLTSTFGVLALLFHIRWRNELSNKDEASSRTFRWNAWIALFFYAVALFSGESGIAITAYLFAFAVTLDRTAMTQRLLSLLPYLLITVIWRVIYNWTGHGTNASAIYIDPVANPLQFASDLVIEGPILFMAQWFPIQSDMFLFSPLAVVIMWWCAALSSIGIIGYLLKPLLRNDATARFWGLGMVISLVPICAAFPMDRLLVFVGIGGMGLLAQLINQYVFTESSAVAKSQLRRKIVLCLCVVHLVLAPLMLPLRSYTFGFVGDWLSSSIDSLDKLPDIDGKTIIVVNAPMIYFSAFISVMRDYEGKSIPAQAYTLAPNEPNGGDLIIKVEDEFTLRVRPTLGFSRIPMTRGRDQLMEVGYTVDLEAMRVEVTELSEAGHPSEALFHFKKKLNDSSHLWLHHQDSAYQIYQLPKVGKSDIVLQGLL